MQLTMVNWSEAGHAAHTLREWPKFFLILLIIFLALFAVGAKDKD